MTHDDVDLSDIPEVWRAQALKALDDGDVDLFLGSADNMRGLYILLANVRALKTRGLYEPALLRALTSPRVNLSHFPLSTLVHLVGLADRAALRSSGDPLPGPGPFTVYRGVAGRGRARRVRGLSWTLSLPVAAWFARRSANVFELPDPAVYQLTVTETQVLAYANEGHRREAEILVLCSRSDRPLRCLHGMELEDLAERHGASMHAENIARMQAIKATREKRDTSRG